MYKNLIYFYTFYLKIMKNFLYFLLPTILFINSCSKKLDPFLITEQSVGLLTDSTLVKDLKLVFPNDSLNQFIGGDEFLGKSNIIKIFEKKTQKLLLELTPKEPLDSLSTIQNIRIIDNRYKTGKAIDKFCDFGCLSSKHKISSIQNTLRNIIVSIDEINAYFTIDKKELPENLRYNMSLKIDKVSIPQSAKIKDFFIQWY